MDEPLVGLLDVVDFVGVRLVVLGLLPVTELVDGVDPVVTEGEVVHGEGGVSRSVPLHPGNNKLTQVSRSRPG